MPTSEGPGEAQEYPLFTLKMVPVFDTRDLDLVRLGIVSHYNRCYFVDPWAHPRHLISPG